ncbi:MAG: sulfotransferase domain-containing protein [Pseudomonadota bacterium]
MPDAPITRPAKPGPGLIGIGAQKCASSWVHAALGGHPAIGVSSPKEIDFFSYYFDRGRAWYEAHFAQLSAFELRAEVSPSYFHDPRSPSRLADWDPEIRVVAVLRDPVERAYSNHLHEVIKGHVRPCTFEDGLANNPAYLEQGRYAEHLARWYAALPREQILVLIAEDIAAAPDAAAARLYRFCGVDPALRPLVLSERRNESDRARLPILRSVLRAQGTALRRLGLESTLIRIKRLPGVAGMLRANSIDLRGEIPPMRAETRARLTELFAPQMAPLAQLIGRDALPWASFRAALAQAAE